MFNGFLRDGTTTIPLMGSPQAFVEVATHDIPTNSWLSKPTDLYLGRSNSFAMPLHEASHAWVLVARSAINTLDLNARHTLNFISDVPVLTSITWQNLVVCREPQAVIPSNIDADPLGAILVELADVRWLCKNPTYAVPISARYNVRNAATGATPYTTDSLDGAVAWTWATMVEDIWTTMATWLGTFPGLPFVPDGTPEGWVFPGVSAWDALTAVLMRLGCAVRADLTLDAGSQFSIVQIGAADAATDTAITDAIDLDRKIHDGEFEDETLGRMPYGVRVFFARYGGTLTPPHPVDKIGPLSADAEPGVYTPIWDDLPAIYDASNVLQNGAACDTRAAERSADFYRMRDDGGGRLWQRFSGLLELSTGSTLKGVRWVADDRGVWTEIVRHPFKRLCLSDEGEWRRVYLGAVGNTIASDLAVVVAAGLTSIEGATGPAVDLSLGTSGTDLSWALISATEVRLNVPDASYTARGVVSLSAQTWKGSKFVGTANIGGPGIGDGVGAIEGDGVTGGSTGFPSFAEFGGPRYTWHLGANFGWRASALANAGAFYVSAGIEPLDDPKSAGTGTSRAYFTIADLYRELGFAARVYTGVTQNLTASFVIPALSGTVTVVVTSTATLSNGMTVEITDGVHTVNGTIVVVNGTDLTLTLAQVVFGAVGETMAATGTLTVYELHKGASGTDAAGSVVYGGIVTTVGTSVGTSGIADNAVTNAKLADMAAWTYKIRNAGTSGDPSDAALANFTTEASPAAGDFLIGFLDTGEIRKFDFSTITGGANTALSNLAAVAINTTLVSDTDITDDLGTLAIRWRTLFTSKVSTGDTAGDTLLIQGYDVDGAAGTTFITITANNTPTCDLSTAVTMGGNAIYNAATTAWASAFALSGDITPAQITASQNDYDPTGLSTASVLRLDSDAAWSITGIAGGADGRILILHNIGAFTITLENADAGSIAGNRFDMGADVAIATKQVAAIQYDSTNSRWRYVGIPGSAGAGDVVGPASATDNAIARYDLTTGKLIQNSVVTIADNGMIVTPVSVFCGAVYLYESSGVGPQALGLIAIDALAANRTLSISVGDADRTLTIAGDATISGTNTGDGQPLDATLTALAALTIAADSLTIGTGVDAFTQVTFAANTFPAKSSAGALVAKTISDFAFTFLDDAAGTNVLTTLGLSANGKSFVTAADYAAMRVLLLPSFVGNALKNVRVNAGETDVEYSAAGSGTVTGSGTDNRAMRWDGTTAAQDSNITIADTTGAMTNSASLSGGNLISFTNTSTGASSTGGYFAATGATGATFGLVGTTDSTDNASYGVFASRGGTDNAGLCAEGIDVQEMTEPATPPTGWARLYAVTNRLYYKNDGGTVYGPIAAGDALVANPLSQFAATTSAQLAGVISDETGSGVLVFGTAPTFATTITVGAAGGATGQILLKGTTSGTVTIKTADAAGTYTLTLPTDDGTANQLLKTDGAGVLSWTSAGAGDALTTNPLSQFAATTSAQLAGVISDETGSGLLVFATSPTLVTPILGAATATSINGLAIVGPAIGSTLDVQDGKTITFEKTVTFDGTDGKTLTFNNTLTFNGTDVSTIEFGAGGTVAYVANKLSVFAATTSAELAGVISDETGSGLLVFGTAPTLASTVTIGTAGGTTGAALFKGTTSGTVTLTVAAAAGTHTIKLPTADGSSGQALKTDGSGQWGWVTLTTGTVTSVATAGLATGGTITSTGTITVTAAVQSDMETATSTTTAVTPAVAKYHPGSLKAWTNFNGTGTIAERAGYNTAAPTDVGTGDWTVNIATDFSSANFSYVGVSGGGLAGGVKDLICPAGSDNSAGAIEVRCVNFSSTLVDAEFVNLMAAGDQA